ncbi:MAG TPA: hypothetical protein VGQ37_18580 [Vicinamibacterales bacterium]|jgi:hypothetical protein|nr:hypothetical protein [Vicinamibacterales bacterium]
MVEFLRGQWKDLTNMIDPFSIMLMEGFFVVPLVMAALFYPLEVLIGVVAVLLVGLAIFETIEWMRHHPHHAKHRDTSGWHLPL